MQVTYPCPATSNPQKSWVKNFFETRTVVNNTTQYHNAGKTEAGIAHSRGVSRTCLVPTVKVWSAFNTINKPFKTKQFLGFLRIAHRINLGR